MLSSSCSVPRVWYFYSNVLCDPVKLRVDTVSIIVSPADRQPQAFIVKVSWLDSIDVEYFRAGLHYQ